MRKTALLLIVFQFCGHAQAAPWQTCLHGAVSVPLEHYNAPPSMLGSIDGLPARFFLAPRQAILLFLPITLSRFRSQLLKMPDQRQAKRQYS